MEMLSHWTCSSCFIKETTKALPPPEDTTLIIIGYKAGPPPKEWLKITLKEHGVTEKVKYLCSRCCNLLPSCIWNPAEEDETKNEHEELSSPQNGPYR